MGTRNLTMVVWNNETKIAQYGQWDGYPSGQGITSLNFLKKCDLNQFKERLKNLKFITSEEIEKKYVSCGATPSCEFVTMDISDKFKSQWPELDRDCAAAILEMVYNGDATELFNNESFAQDGLFCEWAYVIDLDKNTFEVYSGFGKEPLNENDRFYLPKTSETVGRSEYSAVSLVKSYNLDNLPDESQFLSECDEE
jgi:hypothetical protein